MGVSPDLLVELLFSGDRLRIVQQQRRPLAEHLADYRQYMVNKGSGAKHVRDSFRRLRVMVKLCRAKAWADLQPQAIRAALHKVTLAGPRPSRPHGVGLASANHYLVSLRTFCNWMVNDTRAERSPCRGIKPFRAETDPRHPRRAATEGQIARLVDAAQHGKSIGGISGTERAMGYVVAVMTGLRSNELQSIGAASLHLDDAADPHLVIEAKYSKGKRRHVVRLRAELATMLRAYVASAGRTEKLLRRPKNPMRALKADLAAAGIPYCENGEYLDFHALRHTFVTDAANTGANPKELQTLARHQDVRTTLKVYAHVSAEKQRAVLERMPSIGIAGAELASALAPKSPLDERTHAHGTATSAVPRQTNLSPSTHYTTRPYAPCPP